MVKQITYQNILELYICSLWTRRKLIFWIEHLHTKVHIIQNNWSITSMVLSLSSCISHVCIHGTHRLICSAKNTDNAHDQLFVRELCVTREHKYTTFLFTNVPYRATPWTEDKKIPKSPFPHYNVGVRPLEKTDFLFVMTANLSVVTGSVRKSPKRHCNSLEKDTLIDWQAHIQISDEVHFDVGLLIGTEHDKSQCNCWKQVQYYFNRENWDNLVVTVENMEHLSM